MDWHKTDSNSLFKICFRKDLFTKGILLSIILIHPFISEGQMTQKDKRLFIEHCDQAIFTVPDMEYYSCVGLCAFDAVFSIQTRYESVVNPLVDRFCALMDIPRHAPNPHALPSIQEQVTVSVLCDKLRDYTPQSLANALHNHQRTSSRGGILKTEAFLQYLDVFQQFEVNTYQDINRLADEEPALEQALRSIKGQNVAVDYFFMLSGDEDGVKVDTHLRNFVRDAVGHDLTPEQIKDLFREAVDHYRQNGYPDMTARHLDHIVWTWQKSR